MSFSEDTMSSSYEDATTPGANCDCGSAIESVQYGGVWQGSAWQGSSGSLLQEVPVEEAGVSLYGLGFKEWALPVYVLGMVGVFLAVLSMMRALCQNRQALWQLLHDAGEQAPMGEGLHEKILEVKVGQLRALLQLCCYGLIPLSVLAPFWASSWNFDSAAVVCLAQLLLSVFALVPKLVSPWSFDAVCCTLAALVTLAVTPWTCCEGHLLLMLGLVNGIMMALVSVRRTMPRKVPVLLFMTLPFGLATSSVIMLRGRALFLEWRLHFAAGQLLLVVLMTAAAPFLERRGRLWMFKLLEREELQEAFAASQCLLRSCFDVVVELGSDGSIVSAGPELGALLLRDRQCMQGLSFPELLEEEEKEEFQRRLASSAAREIGLAESMQLSMKDACSNLLRLEAMWYEHRRGRAKHFMLGLREAPEQPGHVQGNEAFEEHGVPETCSVSSGSSMVDAGALLVLDVTCAGWPVRQATASFRIRVGRLRRGACFLERVARPERFRSWLTKALRARETAGEQPPDCRLKLKMPNGKLRAHCSLAGDTGLDMERVALLFHGIRAETEEEGPAAPSRNQGTSPRSSMSSLSDEKAKEPAMLVLNAAEEGWPVLRVAPGFQASMGQLCEGASFLELLSKPASFHRWLCRALEAQANGAEQPAEGQLTLRMPQGRVKVLCSLANAEGPPTSGSLPLLLRSAEGSGERPAPLGGRRCSL